MRHSCEKSELNRADNPPYRSSFAPGVLSYRQSWQCYPLKNCADNPTGPITKSSPKLGREKLDRSYLLCGYETSSLTQGQEERRKAEKEIEKAKELEQAKNKPPSWMMESRDKWSNIKYKHDEEEKSISEYSVDRFIDLFGYKIVDDKNSIPSEYSDSKLGLLKRPNTGDSAIIVLNDIKIKKTKS